MYFKKKVFAFFNFSASFWVSPLTWRSSLYGRALAWQAQVSRGGRRILGGVLTGEARVSQSCRYTEVTRPNQVQHSALACLKMGGRFEGWPQFLPHSSSVLWQWFGLLHTPRLCNCPSSKPSYTVSYCLACMFGHCIASCLSHLEGAFCCVDSL